MPPTCSKNFLWPEADKMAPSSDANTKKHVQTEAKGKPELVREACHMCMEWQGWHVRFECCLWDGIIGFCILFYLVSGVWCLCLEWNRCSLWNITNIHNKIYQLRGLCSYEIMSTPWKIFCYDVTVRRLVACMLSSSTEPSLCQGFLPLLPYCFGSVLMARLICLRSGRDEVFCVYMFLVREWNHFLCMLCFLVMGLCCVWLGWIRWSLCNITN